MRKIYFLVLLIFVTVVAYVFLKEGRDSSGLTYKEPTPVFFSADKVLPPDKVVVINNEKFEPENLTIKVGKKVTWVNRTKLEVWPASNPHPTHSDYSAFDPELPMKANEAWSFVFDIPGTFPYHDHLDPGKRGVVNVMP